VDGDAARHARLSAGLAEETGCELGIVFHAKPTLVQRSEVDERAGVTLLRRLGIPDRGRGGIGDGADAAFVHLSHLRLRLGLALLGEGQPDGQRTRGVARGERELAAGLRTFPCRQFLRAPGRQGGGEVAELLHLPGQQAVDDHQLLFTEVRGHRGRRIAAAGQQGERP